MKKQMLVSFAHLVLRFLLLLALSPWPAAAHEGGHGDEGPETGRITQIVSGSAAEAAGLRVGDYLVRLAGRTLETTADLDAVIQTHEPNDVVPIAVNRDGEMLELSLRFGERPDGGVSIGIALGLPRPGDPPVPALDEISHDECRGRLRELYPVAELSRRLEVELPRTPAELTSCVEGDLNRMKDPFPAGWCDNVFKIHCGGLGVLTELGEVLADRCESGLRATVEAAARGIEPDAAAVRCLRDRTYERFTSDGVVTEGAACVELFETECASANTAHRGTEAPDADPGRRDASQGPRIASSWPASGPEVLWRRNLGDGYSAILHDAGRLFTMVRDEDVADAEVVIALDAASGHTLWRTSYGHPEYQQQRGYGIGPRSKPALARGRLFTAGIVGTLLALDADDGRILWRRELWGDGLAGNRLSHGYSSSPLAWRDLVVLPVGGPDAGLVAFDQATGRTVWTSPSIRNSFSSPTLVELAGEEQILAFMAEELVSIRPQDGAELWRVPHKNSWGQNISVPLVTADDRIFLSSPQEGARGLQVLKEDGIFRAEEEWANRRMQLYHVTSVFDGERVYGSSGVTSPAFVTAIDTHTGEIAWKVRGFAKANVVPFGDRLLILDEDGLLALASPTPDGLDVEAETQLFDGLSWTVPTVVGETLYARSTREIVALDLGGSRTG